MRTVVDKVLARVSFIYNLVIRRDPRTIASYYWRKDRGDSTLRLVYPLSEDSVVFDVGGYKGDWAEAIAQKYNPYIYIFEPIPNFYANIVGRFRSNSKVSVFNFGLLDETKNDVISFCDDGSSLYRRGATRIEVTLVDLAEFLTERKIKEIDLIKINIEGGEYPLLKRMLASNIVNRCHDIQVQFHEFYPNATELREEIRASLQCTHFLTYDYYFVWENWRRK